MKATEAKELEKEFSHQYGECELIEKIINIIEARSVKVTNSLTAAK